MANYIFLDTGPLGLACKGKHIPKANRCRDWISNMEFLGYRILVAEVNDYEVRRKLIHKKQLDMLAHLDGITATRLVLINRFAMIKAAELWAMLRENNQSTADPKEFDCDTILAAQAISIKGPDDTILIATDNVGHLSRYPDVKVCPLDFLAKPS